MHAFHNYLQDKQKKEGGFCQVKGKKKTPLTAALINITMSLFLFTAAVILLAYIMTKNDIAPSVYKTVYIIICGFIALVMSFLNGKGVKIKPVVMLAVSFAFSTLLSVLPVIAVSGSETGLSVLILPGVCLAASFVGTAAGRKI